MRRIMPFRLYILAVAPWNNTFQMLWRLTCIFGCHEIVSDYPWKSFVSRGSHIRNFSKPRGKSELSVTFWTFFFHSSPWPVPHRAVHLCGQCGDGGSGPIRGPLPRLLQLCLWRLGEEEPPPWGKVSLGTFREPVGAQHASDEAFIRWGAGLRTVQWFQQIKERTKKSFDASSLSLGREGVCFLHK